MTAHRIGHKAQAVVLDLHDTDLAKEALHVLDAVVVGGATKRPRRGGQNLAILQTVCSTCLLHGVNPYEYIRDVAVRVGFHPASRLDELLPMNSVPPPGSKAPES